MQGTEERENKTKQRCQHRSENVWSFQFFSSKMNKHFFPKGWEIHLLTTGDFPTVNPEVPNKNFSICGYKSQPPVLRKCPVTFIFETVLLQGSRKILSLLSMAGEQGSFSQLGVRHLSLRKHFINCSVTDRNIQKRSEQIP